MVEVDEARNPPPRSGTSRPTLKATRRERCGAHLVVFTTGRGTVIGSGFPPVLKVCGNPETYARMTENMDINAGAIITGEKTITEIGDEIFAAILATVAGAKTKAEELGHLNFTSENLLPSRSMRRGRAFDEQGGKPKLARHLLF